MAALRLWNYNKSQEDTARGVRRARVFLGGRLVSPTEGFLVRRAPGHARRPFGQLLRLLPPTVATYTAPVAEEMGARAAAAAVQGRCMLAALASGGAAEAAYVASLERLRSQLPQRPDLLRLQQDYETPVLPCGFLLQLVVEATWGDPHYVGLTGIEVWDAVRGPLPLQPSCLHVHPVASVAALPGMSSDARTPDKLLDGVNGGDSPAHGWLAPLADPGAQQQQAPGPEYERGAACVLSILLDSPVMLSALRVWNAVGGAKGAARGVKSFELYLDGVCVYQGFLRRSPDQGPPAPQSILFSWDKELLAKLGKEVHSHLGTAESQQSVLLVNDGRIQGGVQERAATAKQQQQPKGPPTARPATALVTHA